ncbi:MAG: YceI family protein [Bacteroidia bacterium]|nr:YceI family protein [Bacteroidia bacterium]
MKKLILSLLVVVGLTANAQTYKSKKDASSVHFLSKSPLEDIEATNKNPLAAYKVESGDLQFAVVMSQFKFKAALMEEHFNENYIETDKKVVDAAGVDTYPNRTATFKGKLNEKIDLTKDGENKVTVTGKMTLHGVTKDVTTEGTITKKGDDLIVVSKFKIKVADYNIKVPSLYVQNIAEVVDVNVNITLEPFVKK